MLARCLVLATALVAGCYKPGSFASCELACAPNGTCPDGLACNGANMCADTAATVCTNPDAPPGDGAACVEFDFSNVDARFCDLATRVDLVADTAFTIDTDHPETLPSGVSAELVNQKAPGASQVFVIAARSIRIAASTTITVTGSHPLVLLADTITIEGKLNFDAAMPADQRMCSGKPGTSNGVDGTGGGGGGYHRLGGHGGASASQIGSFAAGGLLSPNTKLQPLEMGCGGGSGGEASQNNGAGGAGGGGLQFSARNKLAITGNVTAHGGPGKHAATPLLGGGGGGGGGPVLLEAPMIELAARAVCSTGGGGGGTIATNGDGKAGTCLAAGTGGSGSGAGSGGTGGHGEPVNGADGTDGNSMGANSRGGGGGGGAAGRIVTHGTVTDTGGAGAVTIPAAGSF